jgi:hypothetical protein
MVTYWEITGILSILTSKAFALMKFPDIEFNYLKDLYDSTNGKEWKNNSNWNFENIALYNPCLQPWYGLKASCEEGQTGILSIKLRDNLLIGQLPSPLVNFSLLNIIDFSSNQLFGSLPYLIRLPSLTSLDFGFNLFDCTLPDDLLDPASFKNLDSLNGDYAGFTGTLPSWIYKKHQTKRS